MSTWESNEPEGWTNCDYKSFKVTNEDESESSTEEDSSDDEEQIFAISPVIRRPKYKKLVEKEELLPE